MNSAMRFSLCTSLTSVNGDSTIDTVLVEQPSISCTTSLYRVHFFILWGCAALVWGVGLLVGAKVLRDHRAATSSAAHYQKWPLIFGHLLNAAAVREAQERKLLEAAEGSELELHEYEGTDDALELSQAVDDDDDDYGEPDDELLRNRHAKLLNKPVTGGAAMHAARVFFTQYWMVALLFRRLSLLAVFVIVTVVDGSVGATLTGHAMLTVGIVGWSIVQVALQPFPSFFDNVADVISLNFLAAAMMFDVAGLPVVGLALLPCSMLLMVVLAAVRGAPEWARRIRAGKQRVAGSSYADADWDVPESVLEDEHPSYELEVYGLASVAGDDVYGSVGAGTPGAELSTLNDHRDDAYY
eukprot:NODE_2132_length_1131_cov_65.957171_g2114_i0.p1 GENE.NODE_2132_length_1131_cov_65.957171_g2114_i0~~NODE_2132_length_1131_cov_65.957171_g2114_i0.p1  ORF type:complete len:368 (-),score=106.15 NODE_2132_length_1131_cov_65.957171_g2114_i0:28-1092(-)